MEENLIDSRDDLRIFSFDKVKQVTQTKVFQKYKVVFVVVGFGLFLGASVQMGILGGILAGLGTYTGMERLKEGCPSLYNWVLENPGWVELASIVVTTGIFGLTLGGVFISLISNFTMSATLDWIAEKDGLIKNAERLSIGRMIRNLIAYIVNGTKSLMGEFKTEKVKTTDVIIPEVLPALPA